jgi:hypothetical protein
VVRKKRAQCSESFGKLEALFGLGKAAESEAQFATAKKVAPEPWMINTTEDQLAKLRALQ